MFFVPRDPRFSESVYIICLFCNMSSFLTLTDSVEEINNRWELFFNESTKFVA